MAVAVSLLGILFILAIIAIVAVAVVIAASKKQPKELSTEDGSYFDGGTLALIGYSLLVGFVTTVTFGIAFPWMCCLLARWKAKHTVVCGKRQVFDGTGVQLIGKFLLWGFLTLITFGIYGFWMALAIRKWITKHTHFVGEEDNNSYFDGGILGLIGTNILASIVTVVPFVGFAWSNVIKLKWITSHTVVDSRRLVFTGTTGQFFLKYLVWGLLTGITFGIYGLFVPVKNLKLVAENTIDHEHTDKALMKASEYRNTVQNAVSANKNNATEFEMELLRAGINDNTGQDALRSFAEGGLRSAQYSYCVKYADGNYTAEPYSSMLKASAEAGYIPAMCLYACTHALDEAYRNDLFSKAAEQGQTEAMKQQLDSYAERGLAEGNFSAADPLLQKAVFYADVLQESGEELSEAAQAKIKACILKLRRIASGKAPAAKSAGGMVAAIVAIVVAVLLLLGIVGAMFFNMTAKEATMTPMGPEMDSVGSSAMYY